MFILNAKPERPATQSIRLSPHGKFEKVKDIVADVMGDKDISEDSSREEISNFGREMLGHILKKRPDLGVKRKHVVRKKDDVEGDAYVPSGVWITGAPLIWGQGFEGQGVTVGVIDTGIDPRHPDLEVAVRRSYVKDPDSKRHHHGSHVAGTIAANGEVKGMAPKATLHDYRVFDEHGGCDDPSVVAQAIRDAVHDGCDILNCSLGDDENRADLRAAIEYAHSHGVLTVSASGNDSRLADWGEDIVRYPGCHPLVLSVAAVDYNSETGKIDRSNTKFSNRNDEVDVCADGFQILSCAPVHEGLYCMSFGTSMACPHVAGAAALILCKKRLIDAGTKHYGDNQSSSTGTIGNVLNFTRDKLLDERARLLEHEMKAVQAQDKELTLSWGNRIAAIDARINTAPRTSSVPLPADMADATSHRTATHASQLHTMVKNMTVPVDVGDYEEGGVVDDITGAGFVSFYPQIPVLNEARTGFYIEELNDSAPIPPPK